MKGGEHKMDKMGKTKSAIIGGIVGAIGGGLGGWIGSSMGFHPVLTGLSAVVLALVVWGIIGKLIWK
jgi:hypothetical protein